MASGLTSTGFGSSFGAGEPAGISEGWLEGGMGGDGSSWAFGAKRASCWLGTLRQMILLITLPLLLRVVIGGVETLARPLDTRRVVLVLFVFKGMVTGCWQ